MSEDVKTQHYLTRDQAIKYIKNKYRKGVSYYVRGRAFGYTVTPDEAEEDGNAKGYEMTCVVPVSQKDAIKYVHDTMHDIFVEKGLRICISDHPSKYGGCMFIG